MCCVAQIGVEADPEEGGAFLHRGAAGPPRGAGQPGPHGNPDTGASHRRERDKQAERPP